MILITGICLFLSSKVDVNRDITKYLDKNSETRIGMDIMDKEFGDNVTSSLRDSYSIVLQHDVKSYSVDAVEAIIQYGLTHGYHFAPLDVTSPGAHQRINN